MLLVSLNRIKLHSIKQYSQSGSMKKITKLLFLCFVVFSLTANSWAQETATFRNPEQQYNIAIELFQNKDFEAASDQFKEVVGELNQLDTPLLTSAKYYLVLCAIELQQSDMKDQISSFIREYPAYSKTPLIYYQLGKLEFKNRKYEKALEAFEKVNINDLGAKDQEEYNFRMGFIWLKQNEPQKAKQYFAKINPDSKTKFAQAANYYRAHIEYLDGNYDEALPVFESLRKDRTYKRAVPFYIIQIYYKQGDFDKILELGPKLLKEANSSRKAEIARLIGDAYYRQGNFEEASNYLELYERSNRKELTRNDYYQLGFTYFKEEKYKRAISNFEKAVGEENEADSLSQNAQYHLAQSYLADNQKQFAANAFLSAYKMNFDKELATESLFKYIELSKNLPNNPYNESISLLENYINNNPNSANKDRAYTLLIDLFYNTKNYQAALESIEKLRLNNPKLKEAYQQIAYSRAVELFNQKKFAEALDLFTKARKYPVDRKIDISSMFWMAECFYQQKNYWGAQKYYVQFLDDPAAKKLDIYNLAYYNLAYTYYKRDNYPEAIKRFTSFVNAPTKINTNLESDAFIRIGDCYFVDRKYAQAINFYDKAISTNAGDLDYAWYQKAEAYGAMSKLDLKEEALKTLARKYPRSPLYDDALYDLGTNNLLQNNNSMAIEWYNKLIQDKPHSPFARKAMLRKGLSYYDNKENAKAIKSLKEVIEQYPASSEAKEALSTLRNIYVEENKVNDYVKFADKLEFIQVSPSEQDSLSFTAAENLYSQNKCAQAISAIDSYLEKYPKGAYLLKANYYRADCLLKQDQFDEAMGNLRFIIDYPDNPYTLKALERVAPVEYNDGNYETALKDYKHMEELAVNKNQIVIAVEGQMECHYQLNNYKEAIAQAKKLLTTEKISQDQMIKAHLIQAKSENKLGNTKDAYREFKITSKLASGAIAAESVYNMAYIDFQNKKYKEAENLIFTIAEKYSSYDIWVGKAFILLADVYLQMDNAFQAKQTLQSIIDNYPKEDLKALAREKLKAIDQMEKKRSEEKKKNAPQDEPIIVR